MCDSDSSFCSVWFGFPGLWSHITFVLVLFFSFFLSFLEIQLIYKVVTFSAIQQSDSVSHKYMSILFWFLFPYRLSRNIWYSFLSYSTVPCLPVIPHTSLCICQSQMPSPSPLPSFPFGTQGLFSKSVSLLLSDKSVRLYPCFRLQI